MNVAMHKPELKNAQDYYRRLIAQKGPEIIKDMKVIMRDLGFYRGPVGTKVTDDFVSSVMKFQLRLGVTADGKWGASTQEKYEEMSEISTALDVRVGGPKRERIYATAISLENYYTPRTAEFISTIMGDKLIPMTEFARLARSVRNVEPLKRLASDRQIIAGFKPSAYIYSLATVQEGKIDLDRGSQLAIAKELEKTGRIPVRAIKAVARKEPESEELPGVKKLRIKRQRSEMAGK